MGSACQSQAEFVMKVGAEKGSLPSNLRHTRRVRLKGHRAPILEKETLRKKGGEA